LEHEHAAAAGLHENTESSILKKFPSLSRFRWDFGGVVCVCVALLMSYDNKGAAFHACVQRSEP
jgi:hypothetical protein